MVRQEQSDKGHPFSSSRSSGSPGDRCLSGKLGGGGGHIDSHTARGVWSHLVSREHINVLEMWAMERVLLLHFNQFIAHKRGAGEDSQLHGGHLYQQAGGTKSPSLCLHVRRILLWCEDHGIRLNARHIPGVVDVLADSLSQGGNIRPTE